MIPSEEVEDMIDRVFLWSSIDSCQSFCLMTHFLDLDEIVLPIDVEMNFDRINYKYHLLSEAQKLVIFQAIV